MPEAKARVERLEPGDRVLIFTDGLAEARNNGAFFPLHERSWRILGHGTVEDGLTSLESALAHWVEGGLDDDIALVLFEYTGGPQRTTNTSATPAWEWSAV
jgi:serine phosphatase RsbU (regulator of sigma subunit)